MRGSSAVQHPRPYALSVCGVFIKLHITAQSGPVILVILCHSHLTSQGGSMMLLLRKSLIRRNEGDTLSLLVQFLLKSWVPCAQLTTSFLFSRSSGLAVTESTVSCLRFFLFPLKSHPFPTWRLQLLCGCLFFFASFPSSLMCVYVCVCVCVYLLDCT